MGCEEIAGPRRTRAASKDLPVSCIKVRARSNIANAHDPRINGTPQA